MKAGWKSARLGEAVKAVLTGPFGSILHKSDYADEGIPLVNPANIVDEQISLDGIKLVGFQKAQSLRSYELQVGDIVIGRRGEIGRCAVVTEEHAGWLCGTGSFIVRPGQTFEPRFLAAMLRAPICLADLVKAAAGATMPNLSNGSLSDLQICYPPLEEQRRIVAVLDKAFAGIATATANAQKNLTNARALFEAYLQTAFDRGSAEWSSYKLGDQNIVRIIDGDRGSNYPSKADFQDSGHCLFLNTKNVRPNGFSFETKMFVSQEKDECLRKGKLTRGDVIMTTRGTIGNLAVYDESVEFEHIRINSGMLIFRPNIQKISPRYLFEILRSGIVKQQIAENVSGAAQPQLPIHTLVKFAIPVPDSLTAQSQIVQSLAEIEDQTNQLEKLFHTKLAALTELKQSLLQKAFAGELT